MNAARKRAEAMARADAGEQFDELDAAERITLIAANERLARRLDAYFSRTRFDRGVMSYRFRPEPIEDE